MGDIAGVILVNIHLGIRSMLLALGRRGTIVQKPKWAREGWGYKATPTQNF